VVMKRILIIVCLLMVAQIGIADDIVLIVTEALYNANPTKRKKVTSAIWGDTHTSEWADNGWVRFEKSGNWYRWYAVKQKQIRENMDATFKARLLAMVDNNPNAKILKGDSVEKVLARIP